MISGTVTLLMMMVLIKRRRRRRRRRRKGSDPRGGGGGADTILLPEAMRAEKSSGRAPAEQLCSSSVTDCAKKRLPMSDLTFTLQCRESSWRKGECWQRGREGGSSMLWWVAVYGDGWMAKKSVPPVLARPVEHNSRDFFI